jgi:hypothetical protein
MPLHPPAWLRGRPSGCPHGAPQAPAPHLGPQRRVLLAQLLQLTVRLLHIVRVRLVLLQA